MQKETNWPTLMLMDLKRLTLTRWAKVKQKEKEKHWAKVMPMAKARHWHWRTDSTMRWPKHWGIKRQMGTKKPMDLNWHLRLQKDLNWQRLKPKVTRKLKEIVMQMRLRLEIARLTPMPMVKERRSDSTMRWPKRLVKVKPKVIRRQMPKPREKETQMARVTHWVTMRRNL